MRKKFVISTAASLSALVIGMGTFTASSAQASTTSYLCPTAAAVVVSPSVVSNPTGAAFDSTALGDPSKQVTNLVGCNNPYFPAMNSGPSQDVRNIILDFGALPESIFVNNVFKVRITGTYGNGGYSFNIMERSITQTSGSASNPAFIAYQQQFHVPTSAPEALLTGTDTIDYSITVSDPAKRAKLIAGDYVLQIVYIGGVANFAEGVSSVSIPYMVSEVSFDSNGGTGTQTAQQSGIPIALSANTFTRSGYNFAGWNTSANGSGTTYADTASFPFSADTTLYAQWTTTTSGSVGSSGSSGNASLAVTGGTNKMPFVLVGMFLVFAGLSLSLFSVARRRVLSK